MDDKVKLINYYEELCRVLNKNGFRMQYSMEGVAYEEEFKTDIEMPRLTMMSITENLAAYSFLKNKGLIRTDLCHYCGEAPIDGTFTFTEPINFIKINICRACHSIGKSEQEFFKKVTKPNSGCLFLFTFLFSIFFALIILAVI